ncbi:hypothetical protein CIT25_01700 [Mesorhizobium mediterraneum]|uniref:Uncharacterized protein n=1 Tax=Mesorhizobium mediterraneum TaxID=43617 RepID=A0AB36RIZ0_9HYPH|nr:hypothetical protein CIT25_01700 [Mesorhizobium mediterraneum]
MRLDVQRREPRWVFARIHLNGPDIDIAEAVPGPHKVRDTAGRGTSRLGRKRTVGFQPLKGWKRTFRTLGSIDAI